MRVAVIGTGLVGGSIGLACKEHGHDVVGFDRDRERSARALELGAVGRVALDAAAAVTGADVAFVAVPVGAVANVVVELLEAGAPIVSDVGSVKGPIVEEVARRCPDRAGRYVAGHPMAGSEQDGVDGARADLFVGAAWVLTPTPATDESAFTTVRGLAQDFGAEVVSVTPGEHDVLVSFVSHVPQLAASTLMDVAITREEEHRALLRLAAGGFRDMTRIAASHPAIWLDILTTNREAVLVALDAYLAALSDARALVAGADREELAALLERARAARRNLPVAASLAGDLVELLIPVADRPGVLAEVTTTAGRLGVNVSHIDMVHSLEGQGGVLELTIAAANAPALESALHDLGYQTSRREMT